MTINYSFIHLKKYCTSIKTVEVQQKKIKNLIWHLFMEHIVSTSRYIIPYSAQCKLTLESARELVSYILFAAFRLEEPSKKTYILSGYVR